MTRAPAFALLLLGPGTARTCLCRFGRCWTARSGKLFRSLLLFQDLLGSQVVVQVLALGSPLLLPKAVSELLYLLFRGHGYLPHEELMREDQIMSRFCAALASHFSPLAWSHQLNAGKGL